MALPELFYILIAVFSLFSVLALGVELRPTVEKGDLETYIVHVKKMEGRLDVQLHDVKGYHQSFLPVRTADSSADSQRLLYSYRNVISGFSARLTAEEVEAMKEKDGFISARPERKYRPFDNPFSQLSWIAPRNGILAEIQFWQGSYCWSA
ncbi:Subtilisin-like protease SBT3 [Sesamum alatum]|uniref:Subtilisin-like protease SBT3 n=1 Tax=Sesamum alatum TaxID=300844 RepID=A0AAE2CUQ8_9LAMI|nr:Subtilisin-like protease SBT3 [Sesamum alatum]